MLDFCKRDIPRNGLMIKEEMLERIGKARYAFIRTERLCTRVLKNSIQGQNKISSIGGAFANAKD